jgi:hypothetical protein
MINIIIQLRQKIEPNNPVRTVPDSVYRFENLSIIK